MFLNLGATVQTDIPLKALNKSHRQEQFITCSCFTSPKKFPISSQEVPENLRKRSEQVLKQVKTSHRQVTNKFQTSSKHIQNRFKNVQNNANTSFKSVPNKSKQVVVTKGEKGTKPMNRLKHKSADSGACVRVSACETQEGSLIMLKR